MTTIVFGNGTPATVRLGNGTALSAPPALGAVVFTTTGATFAPVVELVSGSSAAVTWQDGTGDRFRVGRHSYGTAVLHELRRDHLAQPRVLQPRRHRSTRAEREL
jgi:hypothetical protein